MSAWPNNFLVGRPAELALLTSLLEKCSQEVRNNISLIEGPGSAAGVPRACLQPEARHTSPRRPAVGRPLDPAPLHRLGRCHPLSFALILTYRRYQKVLELDRLLEGLSRKGGRRLALGLSN